jgi:hypothetical protein
MNLNVQRNEHEWFSPTHPSPLGGGGQGWGGTSRCKVDSLKEKSERIQLVFKT